MTDSMVDFSSFRSAYWMGHRQLRDLEQVLVAFSSSEKRLRQLHYDKIHTAATLSLEKLRESDYGSVLCYSTPLHSISEELEQGLSRLIGSMSEPEKSSLQDCLKPYRVKVRAFHFFGRAGWVFARYRETGQYVSKEDFTQITESICSKTDALINEIESMLSPGLFQAVYEATTVNRFEKLLDLLYAVNADFSKISGRSRFNQYHRDVFKRDHRSLPRQFVESIVLICFQLFGHLQSSTLRQLLDIKADTAEKLGLAHWEMISKKIDNLFFVDTMEKKNSQRTLRRDIQRIGQRAENQAEKAQWEMLPVIKHFNAKNQMQNQRSL